MPKSKKKKNHYSSVKDHERRGTKLVAKMNTLNVQPIEWERDLMVEHLWIASLETWYPANRWHVLYNRFLDAIDPFMPEGVVAVGWITDLGWVPEGRRQEFKEAHRQLVHEAFHKPFGRIMAFYPDAPAHWLVLEEELEKEGSLDPKVELRRLSELLVKLLPAKDLVVGHLRAVPLNRLLKHNKVQFFRGMRNLDLLPKYPDGCTETEKYQVQQFVRMQMNLQYQITEAYKSAEWPKYFWRHNYDLVPCLPSQLSIRGAVELKEQDAKPLYDVLSKNAQQAVDYLKGLAVRVRCDLYDPTRDEILLGLFARVTRLYTLVGLDPALWPRDISGILLRCITDTAICFCYLGQRGTPEEFQAFKRYGEGKEKLLMLHLQDQYATETSLEGQTAEQIAQALGGGFNPELIDIELDNWTKDSARDLAIKAGMERFYRLVYDPASSDLHGTWVSLKHSNLQHCAQVLHRFHRLPTYTEAPAFVETLRAVQDIYRHCLSIGVSQLGYPKMEPAIAVLTTPTAAKQTKVAQAIGQ